MDNIISNVDSIIGLYKQYGSSDYIGENMSQLEHMTRAAMIAEKNGENNQIILAAFLHDIGHLVEINNQSMKMGNLGVINHELVGRNFLIEKGFDLDLANLVGNHVKAKRYLVTKYQNYINDLSEASRQTLILQKNSMSPEEMSDFESDPLFVKSIKLRICDDQSKNILDVIKPIEYYQKMMIDYLSDLI